MAVHKSAGRLGALGEHQAAQYLESLGWDLLERNWRCQRGELDIVAFDPAAQAIVFVEVKTRSGLGFGAPLEAITRAKVARLRDLAWYWLQSRRVSVPNVRLDGVGVLQLSGEPPQFSHVRGLES